MKILVNLALGLAIGTWAAQAHTAYDGGDWLGMWGSVGCAIMTATASMLFIRAP